MDSAKQNIKQVVGAYITRFPEEYQAFKDQMQSNKTTLADREFGTLADIGSGEERNVTRALYEIPETLFAMLVQNLSEEQMTWLKSGGENGVEGGRWFARTFPVFAVPDSV